MEIKQQQLVIVGQGPSRAGSRHSARRRSREACTGRVGRKLAKLLRMPEVAFYAMAARVNLNARFNGKAAKGDAFNVVEGLATARRILVRHRNGEKLVLLGRTVGRCFGVTGDYLRVTIREGHPFLLFPHPSGINRWWNDARNRRRAGRALRRFVTKDL